MLHQTVKAMIRTSRGFQNLTTLVDVLSLPLSSVSNSQGPSISVCRMDCEFSHQTCT